MDDESTWIYNQLASGTVPLFSKTGLGNSISRDDIIRFLDLHHVQKLDVSILINVGIFLLIYLIFILLMCLTLLVSRFPLLPCIGKKSA